MTLKQIREARKRIDHWFDGRTVVQHPETIKQMFTDLGLGQWTINDLLMGVTHDWVWAKLSSMEHEAKVAKKANDRRLKLERRRGRRGPRSRNTAGQ